MDIFFLDRDKFDASYNCSGVDLATEGKANIPLGICYFTAGAIFEILYIPCLKVLSSPALRRNSAHKIMFQLGVLDMSTLTVNSLITGYLTIIGAVYCTYPNFIYIAGAFGLGLWYATCITSFTLGINRSIDFWYPELMQKLFNGYRTYCWCSIAFVYGFYFAWTTKPITYSSNAYAWFFDPYFEMTSVKVNHMLYENAYHTIHNSATVVITFCMYFFLILSVWCKYRKTHLHSRTVTDMQKQIIIQACLICLCNLIAASIYIYMQYLYTPTWLIVVGQSTWIGFHGGAVIIYLTFNPTIRETVLNGFLRRSSEQVNLRNMTTTHASSVAPQMMSFVAEL